VPLCTPVGWRGSSTNVDGEADVLERRWYGLVAFLWCDCVQVRLVGCNEHEQNPHPALIYKMRHKALAADGDGNGKIVVHCRDLGGFRSRTHEPTCVVAA
jgi:hypothetical protein